MRPKGSMNKNSAFLLNRLQEIYGESFNPVMNAAENAMRMQTIADGFKDAEDDNGEPDHDARQNEFGARIKCVEAFDRVAQYVQPKLKAVEMTGADGKDLMPEAIKIIYE